MQVITQHTTDGLVSNNKTGNKMRSLAFHTQVRMMIPARLNG